MTDKYSDILSDGGLDPRNKFDEPKREWFGLTDKEIIRTFSELDICSTAHIGKR